MDERVRLENAEARRRFDAERARHTAERAELPCARQRAGGTTCLDAYHWHRYEAPFWQTRDAQKPMIEWACDWCLRQREDLGDR